MADTYIGNLQASAEPQIKFQDRTSIIFPRITNPCLNISGGPSMALCFEVAAVHHPIMLFFEFLELEPQTLFLKSKELLLAL